MPRRTSPNPAGRPITLNATVRIGVLLSADQAAHIKAAPEGLSAYIRKLIDREMTAQK